MASRFNEFIVSKLLSGAEDGLVRHGIPTGNIDVAWVPGAFEIPVAALRLAQSGKYDAVICLGAVIRGSTSHYDYVCAEVSKGVAQASLQTGKPVLFGVLTTDTIEQAIDLAGYKAVVMMFGLTAPQETVSIRPFEIFKKELELKASYINPYTQTRALRLIDSGRLDVSSMVHEVCGLDRLADILANPELRARGKYIISPEK